MRRGQPQVSAEQPRPRPAFDGQEPSIGRAQVSQLSSNVGVSDAFVSGPSVELRPGIYLVTATVTITA